MEIFQIQKQNLIVKAAWIQTLLYNIVIVETGSGMQVRPEWFRPWNKQYFFQVVIFEHIEAKTKWPIFSRRQFRMHFLEWKYLNLY